MKELVEPIARALVDRPEDVKVETSGERRLLCWNYGSIADDLGKVIGRQGRTAKAIRTVLGAAGMKMQKRFTLEILED